MKRVKIKRLLYHSPASGEIFYSAEQFDGNLTDYNILCAFYEVGKTAWIGDNLWLLRDNIPIYRITVESCIQYQKTWFDLMLDAIRRI